LLLISEKEKRPVLLDRPAERAPELLLSRRGNNLLFGTPAAKLALMLVSTA